MYKDFLSGLAYVLQMHMGNDVLYFPEADQRRVYSLVKEGIIHRIVNGGTHGIRMITYCRLLIEAMFAYNHFEDEDEHQGLGDIEFQSGEDNELSSSSSEDEGGKKKPKKKMGLKNFKVKSGGMTINI